MSEIPQPYDELGALYDEWCSEVDEDIPFYSRLAGAVAATVGNHSLRILELGGGSGRVAIPLAQQGHHVTAIDTSETQLARLRDKADAAGVATNVATVLDDMRAISDHFPPQAFDLVIAPFRALLHVTADRDELFGAVADLLAPQGALAFDVYHPTRDTIDRSHGRWLHRRVARTSHGKWKFSERIEYSPPPIEIADKVDITAELSVRCEWSRSNRASTKLRRGATDVEEPSEGDTNERIAMMHLHLAPADDWALSLARAGYVIDGSYGWFDGRPMTPDDEDSIWVAVKDASTHDQSD